MPRLARANEIVERDVEPRPDRSKFLLHPVAILKRLEPALLGLAIHVLRVLVVAHDEADVEAAQPLVPGDEVGGNLFVRRAEMRPVVDVVDRGGEIETRHVDYRRPRSNHARSASAWTVLTGLPVALATRTQSSNSGTAFRISPRRPATLTRTDPPSTGTSTH